MRNGEVCFGAFGGIRHVGWECRSAVQEWSQPTELSIPRVSQRGTVSQRIGLTDITITLSQARRGWARDLGQKPCPTEKSGARARMRNTTISFSNDVSVEGKTFACGHVRPAHDPRQGSVDESFFLEEFNFVGQL